jgi:hypothetical protein
MRFLYRLGQPRPSRPGAAWAGLLALVATPLACAAGLFDVQMVSQQLPEMGTVTNCHLRTDRGAFSFMPPTRWSMRTEPEDGRILFVAPDHSVMTVRISDAPALLATDPSPDQLRQVVRARYPDAVLLEETPCYTEGETGRLFTLRCSQGNQSESILYLALVRVEGTAFEFVLNVRPERSVAHTGALRALLTSFQTAPTKPVAR